MSYSNSTNSGGWSSQGSFIGFWFEKLFILIESHDVDALFADMA